LHFAFGMELGNQRASGNVEDRRGMGMVGLESGRPQDCDTFNAAAAL